MTRTLRLSLVAFLLAVAATLSSCVRQEGDLATGQTVLAKDLPGAGTKTQWVGDAAYAVVRYDALPGLYDDFRSTLSSLGLVKWDARFDCNRFATLYIGVAHTKFAVAAWHSSSQAQALALAEVWYARGGDVNRAHAIVLAYTDRGPVYIEPQTGRELALTPAELASVTLRKW